MFWCRLLILSVILSGLLHDVVMGECYEEKGGARTAMGKVSALLVIQVEGEDTNNPELGVAVILSSKVLLTSSYNFFIGDEAKKVADVKAYAGMTTLGGEMEDWKAECELGATSGIVMSYIWGYTRCQAKVWDEEKGVILDNEDARRRKKDERLALIFLKNGFTLTENVYNVYMDRFSNHEYPPSIADCSVKDDDVMDHAICQGKDETRLHVTSEQLVCTINQTKVCREVLAGVQCCPRLMSHNSFFGRVNLLPNKRYLCMLTGPYLTWIIDTVDLYKSTLTDLDPNNADIKDVNADENLVFGQQVAFALRDMERYASAKAKLEMQKILFKYHSGNPKQND